MAISNDSKLKTATSRDRAAVEAAYAAMSAEQRSYVDFNWGWHGRRNQQTPPGHWHTWLTLAGRGWGKTRTGAEFIIAEAERFKDGRGALVGATGADVWDVMVHGESGIIAHSPPWFKAKTYKRSVVFPNGFQATAYSAEEPDRLRGPQHHVFWADELAAWQYPESWDMLQFGLRLGMHPRGIVTTTPRPIPEIKALIKDESTYLVTGSTFENKDNLPASFFHSIIAKYEGTRLGDQELYAKILGDTPGALWKSDQIEALRVTTHPQLWRVVVAVDPAVSTKEGSAETGIVVVGVGDCPCSGVIERHGFVLEDATGHRSHEDEPVHLSPLEWARSAIKAYRKWNAHRMICETNQGGDLVISNIESVDPTIHPTEVKATDGKRTRAEPIAALYEQGKVHHVGRHGVLESQMTTWDALRTGERSPDRVDALVWALSALMLDQEDLTLPTRFVQPWGGQRRYR